MKEKRARTRVRPLEEQLKERDLDTLSQRALRLQRLHPFKIPKVPTLRVWDYLREAKWSYVNGWYRSCIICSSNAVEQSFMHTLIVNSEDWERTYWEIEIKKMTFGAILKEVRKREIKTLTRFVKDADWLRRVRNEIVAHPTYIPDYYELESPEKIIWANRILYRDIGKLLKFFNPRKRKQLENTTLTARTPDGKIVGESKPLKEYLAQPTKIEVATTFDWWAFQTGLLSDLALEVYGRMSKIINGLYAPNHSKSS